MSDGTGFTEVSLAYSDHIGNLNRARLRFEEEARSVIATVAEHVKERCSRPVASKKKIEKTRWGTIHDWSSKRESNWLSFSQGVQVRLDIRRPGYSNFRLSAGFLYLEVVYDQALDRFAFRARFENSNSVSADLDEATSQIVKDSGEAAFPGGYHQKSNTSIIFRRGLSADTMDEISTAVESAMKVVEIAVDQLFPDELYAASTVKDPEGEETSVDEGLGAEVQ